MIRTARALVVTGVVSALIALAAAPAAATDALEDYLSAAEDAEYAGRRMVMTSWEGTSEVGVYDVTHAGHVTLLDDGQTRVSTGKVAAEEAAIAVLDWSRIPLADRYTVVEEGAVTRLGRSAQAIDVYEDGALRAAIVFDEATGAPMLTQMYDGSGNLYRYATMLDFDDQPNLVYADIGTTGRDYDVMLPAGDAPLPASVSGYTRTDVYGDADDWLQTFYSDGLFSFSVFETEGAVTLNQFSDAGSFEAGGTDYSLLVRPAEVWVTWRTSDATFVLVGDLPPDHLEQVLEALPAPERPGFLRRLWRGIFG